MSKPSIPRSRQLNKSKLYPLSPSQIDIFNKLRSAAAATPIVLLEGDTGAGKTLILKHFAQELKASYISYAELMAVLLEQNNPLTSEETIYKLLQKNLKTTNILILDALEINTNFMLNDYSSPRCGLINMVIAIICEIATTQDKRLIFATSHTYINIPSVENQAFKIVLPEFTATDYGIIFENILGKDKTNHIEIDKVFRFASKLSGYQVASLARLVAEEHRGKEIHTNDVIHYAEQSLLISNLDVGQVEHLTPSDLKGTTDLWEALEAHILLPMQNGELTRKLGLKPKRGVLLYGKPGTGKTSIGRALAHKMKGKFFMIDGSFITEPPNTFFKKISEVFKAAEANSPAVIFIDDADVLFKTDHIYGLNRYLLTKLDGLESVNIGHVCVMMTAMDVKDMPPAILRSGRVELWLETTLPNRITRLEILEQHLRQCEALGTSLAARALEEIAELSEGFTPADLRRIVSDAKGLLLIDAHKQRAPKSLLTYLTMATNNLHTLQRLVATALGEEYKFPVAVGLAGLEGGCAG